MFKKFTWAHGIIIALGAFMIFILYLIFVFPMGKQNAEMVSDNYYEEELLYQDVIDAKKNASQLSSLPEFISGKEGITIKFPQEAMPSDGKVDFHLFRTEDSNLDVKKTQVLLTGNTLFIPTKVLFPGSYTLKVKWKKDKLPYQVDYDVQWK